MRSTLRLAACTIAGSLFLAPAAHAATSTTTFNVTATVSAGCSVTAGGDLAFGSYTGSQIDGTTTLSVTCTSITGYTIGLSDGANFDTSRRLKRGTTDYLSYELYKESGRTNRWGNAGAEMVSGTGTGAAQSLTIYGRMPAGGTLVPGSYTDTISVTLTY